ncbi:hypothetical protein VNO77_27505 [Canavalia gladiata]|uniref:PGG domain-containing protein n=1 Tax=Canavalia gladiata TaxID=3824 RepID=A0AAN9KU55_CANGL
MGVQRKPQDSGVETSHTVDDDGINNIRYNSIDDQQELQGIRMKNSIAMDVDESNEKWKLDNMDGIPTDSASIDMDMMKGKKLRRKTDLQSRDPIKSCYEAYTLSDHVDMHKNLKLLLETYNLIKDLPTQANPNDKILSPEAENKTLELKSPMGNTLLHVAAMFGKDHLVEKITQPSQNFYSSDKGSYKKFMIEQNVNGDTALHLAAKAGHISIVKKLVVVYLNSFRVILDANIFMANNQGNTFLHEALYSGHQNLVNQVLFDEHDSCFQSLSFPEIKFYRRRSVYNTNRENKSILYLAIEAGYTELVDKLMASFYGCEFNFPEGKSIFLAAIFKRDLGILESILKRYSEWIHATDTEGRTVIHYAAATGYLEGVEYLLGKYSSCASARDKDGFLPIHLASDRGHVKIVQKLLEKEHCPYPEEMRDNNGRNILHLASQSGKCNVVTYILQSINPKLQEMMINEKDFNGNTPLHLATLCCHPKIVHALTWDKRVNLNLTNIKDQTPLDLRNEFSLENPSFRQRLTWTALKSAGAKHAHSLSPCYIKAPPQNTKSCWDEEAPNMDPYKDRINTLLLVSTLIITITFAAGFTLPGGTNGSGQDQGMALMLNQIWFKLFIFCITVSMYGALSVTITLIWAQLADLTLATLALKVAKPLLGVTLATLSLAFMAGLHLVISDLSWLATTTLALCVILILSLLFLYTLLWFPSKSRNIVARYFSYYPFLFLAWLVDSDEDNDIGKPTNYGDSIPQP